MTLNRSTTWTPKLTPILTQKVTSTRRAQLILIGSAISIMALITIGHYLTDAHSATLHHTYRRLYYVPVVLSAFAYGWRGGSLMALVVSLAYAPHAFFMSHHHRDPAPTSDKLFELILYALVGILTGALVDRERATQRRLRVALSERERFEEALVRSAKLSALGHLLAGVAHELRNPLASILGATEGLERQLLRTSTDTSRLSAKAHLEPDPRVTRLLSLQRKELERLNRALSRFLDFAKTRPPERTWVELSSLVSRVVELARHHEDEGEFRLSDTLSGRHVWADEDQLTQVLLNLTLNAIEARGEEPFLISYHLEESDEVSDEMNREHWCRISVIDRGIGISDELKTRLFEPFFSTRGEGTGLGLSVSRQLIEAHGGALSLECHEGETRASISLPPPSSSPAPSSHPHSSLGSPSSSTILPRAMLNEVDRYPNDPKI